MPKKTPVPVQHPKPIPVSIDHSFAIEAGMLRARLERDLGGDPSTAESELASMASLWSVLVRRAFRLGLVGVASDATVQARQCLQALGLRRRAREVGQGGKRALAAWAEQVSHTPGHTADADDAGPVATIDTATIDTGSELADTAGPDAVGEGGAAVPDAGDAATPLVDKLVDQAALAAPGGPTPRPTSAAPRPLAHGGPGAHGNRNLAECRCGAPLYELEQGWRCTRGCGAPQAPFSALQQDPGDTIAAEA